MANAAAQMLNSFTVLYATAAHAYTKQPKFLQCWLVGAFNTHRIHWRMQ